MARNETEGTVTLTKADLKDLMEGAVKGALAATGTQRLVGKDFHAKVQKIKNKEGEFARPEKPLVPPPGYCIVTDKFGQSPKIVEAAAILHQGANVKPFEKGHGYRVTPLATGSLHGKVKDGSLLLKAFNPYPDGLVTGKGGAKLDQLALLPDLGDPEHPRPIIQAMTEAGGVYFEGDYYRGTVQPAQKSAKVTA